MLWRKVTEIYQESWYNFYNATIDAMKRLASAHLPPYPSPSPSPQPRILCIYPLFLFSAENFKENYYPRVDTRPTGRIIKLS